MTSALSTNTMQFTFIITLSIDLFFHKENIYFVMLCKRNIVPIVPIMRSYLNVKYLLIEMSKK